MPVSEIFWYWYGLNKLLNLKFSPGCKIIVICLLLGFLYEIKEEYQLNPRMCSTFFSTWVGKKWLTWNMCVGKSLGPHLIHSSSLTQFFHSKAILNMQFLLCFGVCFLFLLPSCDPFLFFFFVFFLFPFFCQHVTGRVCVWSVYHLQIHYLKHRPAQILCMILVIVFFSLRDCDSNVSFPVVYCCLDLASPDRV